MWMPRSVLRLSILVCCIFSSCAAAANDERSSDGIRASTTVNISVSVASRLSIRTIAIRSLSVLEQRTGLKVCFNSNARTYLTNVWASFQEKAVIVRTCADDPGFDAPEIRLDRSRTPMLIWAE